MSQNDLIYKEIYDFLRTKTEEEVKKISEYFLKHTKEFNILTITL
jgi:hypothetical protein